MGRVDLSKIERTPCRGVGGAVEMPEYMYPQSCCGVHVPGYTWVCTRPHGHVGAHCAHYAERRFGDVRWWRAGYELHIMERVTKHDGTHTWQPWNQAKHPKPHVMRIRVDYE